MANLQRDVFLRSDIKRSGSVKTRLRIKASPSGSVASSDVKRSWTECKTTLLYRGGSG